MFRNVNAGGLLFLLASWLGFVRLLRRWKSFSTTSLKHPSSKQIRRWRYTQPCAQSPVDRRQRHRLWDFLEISNWQWILVRSWWIYEWILFCCSQLQPRFGSCWPSTTLASFGAPWEWWLAFPFCQFWSLPQWLGMTGDGASRKIGVENKWPAMKHNETMFQSSMILSCSSPYRFAKCSGRAQRCLQLSLIRRRMTWPRPWFGQEICN